MQVSCTLPKAGARSRREKIFGGLPHRRRSMVLTRVRWSWPICDIQNQKRILRTPPVHTGLSGYYRRIHTQKRRVERFTGVTEGPLFISLRAMRVSQRKRRRLLIITHLPSVRRRQWCQTIWKSTDGPLMRKTSSGDYGSGSGNDMYYHAISFLSYPILSYIGSVEPKFVVLDFNFFFFQPLLGSWYKRERRFHSLNIAI